MHTKFKHLHSLCSFLFSHLSLQFLILFYFYATVEVKDFKLLKLFDLFLKKSSVDEMSKVCNIEMLFLI